MTSLTPQVHVTLEVVEALVHQGGLLDVHVKVPGPSKLVPHDAVRPVSADLRNGGIQRCYAFGCEPVEYRLHKITTFFELLDGREIEVV